MASNEAHEWLRYARNDYESAEFLTAKIPAPLEIICYLCQQCAEKSLKGLLVYKEIKIKKTHDLLELIKILELKTDVNALVPYCAMLSNYATVTRYPFPCMEINESQAKTALSYAKIIMHFAEENIK